MKLQNVREALAALEEDSVYQSFADSGRDESFNQFRQEVELIGIRCYELQPDEATPGEMAERLGKLRDYCVGPLARFSPFIERAQAAVHGA